MNETTSPDTSHLPPPPVPAASGKPVPVIKVAPLKIGPIEFRIQNGILMFFFRAPDGYCVAATINVSHTKELLEFITAASLKTFGELTLEHIKFRSIETAFEIIGLHGGKETLLHSLSPAEEESLAAFIISGSPAPNVIQAASLSSVEAGSPDPQSPIPNPQ